MKVSSKLENGVKTIIVVGDDSPLMRNIERMILDAAVLTASQENAVPEYEHNKVRTKAGRKYEPVFTHNPSEEYLQAKVKEMKVYHTAYYFPESEQYIVKGKAWSKMKFAVALCRKFLGQEDNLKGFVRLIAEELGIVVDYSNFVKALRKANKKKNHRR